jgi:hypothetical protein
LDQETRIAFASQLKRQIEEYKQFLEGIESDSVSITSDGHDIKPEMISKERKIIAHLEHLVKTIEEEIYT